MHGAAVCRLTYNLISDATALLYVEDSVVWSSPQGEDLKLRTRTDCNAALIYNRGVKHMARGPKTSPLGGFIRAQLMNEKYTNLSYIVMFCQKIFSLNVGGKRGLFLLFRGNDGRPLNQSEFDAPWFITSVKDFLIYTLLFCFFLAVCQ